MDDGSLVTIILAALGGAGGIAAVITSIASWRKGVREQDVSEDQTALEGYKSLAAEYKADLAAVKAEMQAMKRESEERFARIEAELSDERSTRWAAVQYARELVALILRHMPGIPLPHPPASLADHIIIPQREDPS